MPRCEPLVGKSLQSFCRCGHVVAIHTAERQCPACDLESRDNPRVACRICFAQIASSDYADHKQWHRTMTNLER
jgi:hypothetical protein